VFRLLCPNPKQLEAKRGYHARASYVPGGSADCARGRLEHNGREFHVTRFDKTKFDHASSTDFALLGKHAVGAEVRSVLRPSAHWAFRKTSGSPRQASITIRRYINSRGVIRMWSAASVTCLRSAYDPRYKGLDFSGCQRCHADPHHGAFQETSFRGNCESSMMMRAE
jgi:hypothetical protein